MTYFTYSEGFKSGGVQQRNAGVFGAKAPTYDPEFVESFEIGFKYNHPNGNFVLNVAAFYADYTDIQLETLAPEGIAPQLDNAGEARSRVSNWNHAGRRLTPCSLKWPSVISMR